MVRDNPWFDPIRILCAALSGLLKHFGTFFVNHQLSEFLHFLIRRAGGLGKFVEKTFGWN
jgi:hypothetical protein